MNIAIYNFPIETNEIISRLKSRDWIAHAFKTDDFFQPSEISFNVDENNVSYSLVLDTNIYQFLLNSAKKEAKDTSRDAIGLLVFCQICDIQIDPTFAVYEKINYQNEKASEVVSDLSLFQKINNSDPFDLIPYVMGKIDTYKLGNHGGLDEETLVKGLTKYERLIEWDSLYLILLACISISQNGLGHRKQLEEFFLWLLKKFRQSFVGIIYAALFFSERRLKRMMKFNSSHSSEERKRQLHNMTWDLYIQNTFFRKWKDKEPNSEFVYATADKAFRDLLKIGIEVQIAQNPEPLKKLLTPLDYENICRIWEIEVPMEERIYMSEEWTPEYRTQLISEFEKELLS